MIKIENDCVGCATETYPCMGSACGYRHVPHFYCDKCGCEDDLYHYDDQQLCMDCIIESLKEELPQVTVDDLPEEDEYDG